MNDMSYRIKTVKGELSVRAFAESLGLSATTVQEYLKGRMPPSDFVVRICERFPNVDPWWLMTGQGKAPEAKPIDPQIQEVVTIMERLDDKGKADIVRVRRKSCFQISKNQGD